LRSLIRALRLNFEHQLAKNLKSNSKHFWNYVDSKIEVKTGVATLMSCNGDKATTPLQKAELLNTFFSSDFTSENLNVLPELDNLNYEHQLSSYFQQTKSQGPDGLNPLVLKRLQLSFVFL